MIILISLECTLAQTKMRFGWVTFPNKRPVRGQNVFIVAKGFMFFFCLFSIIVSGDSASYFIEIFINQFGMYPSSNKNGVW